jgi:hypothetical protein
MLLLPLDLRLEPGFDGGGNYEIQSRAVDGILLGNHSAFAPGAISIKINGPYYQHILLRHGINLG